MHRAGGTRRDLQGEFRAARFGFLLFPFLAVFEPVQDGASIKVRTKTGWISGMLPAEGGSASRFAALVLPQTVTIGEGDETRAFKAGGFAVQGGTSVAIEISGQR